MLKEELKNYFIINKETYSKLGLVALLSRSTKCGLHRAKFELVDTVNLEGDNKEEFNKIWKLLTKEEKQELRKYKET